MAIGAFSSDNDDGVCSFVFITILVVITVNTEILSIIVFRYTNINEV